MRNLIAPLHRRGFQIEIVTTYSAGNIESAELLRLTAIHELNKRSRLSLYPFIRLISIVRQFNPDLIHAHTYAGKFWGRAAAAVCNVPVVLTEHGAAFTVGWLENRVSRILDMRTAAVVAFSKSTAEAVSKTSSVKDVRVIPNGIDLNLLYDRMQAREQLGCQDGELAVLTLGRLDAEKGPDVALRTFAMLPESLADKACLHWLGDGPLMREMIAMAKSLGVDKRVVFHGYRQDAALLLAGADIALSPSRIEAAPVWLIEAMAAGIPVVGTPTLGVRDMISPETMGKIAKSNDPPSLANALIDALLDADWRKKASVAMKERSRQYDIELVADAYRDLYNEIIDKNIE